MKLGCWYLRRLDGEGRDDFEELVEECRDTMRKEHPLVYACIDKPGEIASMLAIGWFRLGDGINFDSEY